ncbi:MAG: hypothetical protein ABIG31_02615 [Candidatus Omnitrophota bacterium]
MKNLFRGILLSFLILMILGCLVPVLARDIKGNNLPLTVKTEVDKKSLTVGENIKVTVVVSTASDGKIEFPDTDIDSGSFALKDFGQKERKVFNRKKIIRWYIFNTYAIGEIPLPKLTLKYKRKSDKDWNSYEIPGRPLEVRSLLKDSSAARQLRDIKPPLELPSRFNLFWIIVLVFCAVILVFAYRYFINKKPLQQVVRPKLRPAHDIAYEQLEALQKKDLIRQGKTKEYFVEISDIIRHYLENRFRFRAPQMSTEEFLANVRDSAPLIKTHKDLLKDFLVSCDLVKFAKYMPREEEINAVYLSAQNFIDQTKEEA